jgi:wyosine [tRNA(Phe)-imidazoG37] synthetase (radical SAM superfamily)
MFLHQSTVYGPLSSRRLGNSLGINLLPTKRKVCNFECIYCECGWTDTAVKDQLPTVDQFRSELEISLKELSRTRASLDHITFAGNGEPTLHPQFSEIIDVTLVLRSRYFPEAKIAVLSNATRLRDRNIFAALRKIDERVLKLDAGTERMYQLIDLPEQGITLQKIVEDLKQFNGDLTIQTLFLRGMYKNEIIDNTSPAEVSPWIRHLVEIRPKLVMLYSIERETPAENLEKISKADLESIAKRVREAGIPAESFA